MFKRTVAIILLCAFMFTIAQVGIVSAPNSIKMTNTELQQIVGGMPCWIAISLMGVSGAAMFIAFSPAALLASGGLWAAGFTYLSYLGAVGSFIESCLG